MDRQILRNFKKAYAALAVLHASGVAVSQVVFFVDGSGHVDVSKFEADKLTDEVRAKIEVVLGVWKSPAEWHENPRTGDLELEWPWRT